MKFILSALLLTAAGYFAVASPTGRALVQRLAGYGRVIGDNVVGNLTH